MHLNFKKLFSVFEVIAFDLVAGLFLIYDENTCDRQSTCYQTVLRFWISLRDMFLNSISPRLMEDYKITAMQFSAVFRTREHVQSGRVL